MSKENSNLSSEKTGDTTKEGDSDEEHLPGTFGMKRKRRRKSKGKKSELNKQTTTADSERLQEDTGKPSEKGCTGTPTKKSGTLKLNRDELLAVFGTTNTAPSLEETDETKSKSELKGKKRRRRSKKNQGKRKIEHQLVYLKPLIKSFVTVPKDK